MSSPHSTLLELTSLIAGLKSLPAGKTIRVDSTDRTRNELIQTAEQNLALYTSARDARILAQQQATVRDEAHPDVRKFIVSMHDALKVDLGAENVALLQFGVKPKKKRATFTAEERAARADKARVTRERNHTLGRRQKKQLADDAASAPLEPKKGDQPTA